MNPVNRALSSAVAIPLLLLALAATGAWAKCASLSLTVEGSVSPPAAGTDVRIELYPAARLGGHPILVSPDTAGKFSATVSFNTFNGGGLFGSGLFGHDCSRQPHTVLLSLLAGDKVVGRARLEIPTEFEVNGLNYRVKKAVVLSPDGQ